MTSRGREITEFSQIVDLRRYIMQYGGKDIASSLSWFQYGLDAIAGSRSDFIQNDVSAISDTFYLSRGNRIVEIIDKLLDSYGFALMTFTIHPTFIWTFFVFLVDGTYWLLMRRSGDSGDKLVIEKRPYFRDDVVTLMDTKSHADRATLWNDMSTFGKLPASNGNIVYVIISKLKE